MTLDLWEKSIYIKLNYIYIYTGIKPKWIYSWYVRCIVFLN